ncbi:MAG: c-type cytochrome [Bacteroidota bacterium]
MRFHAYLITLLSILLWGIGTTGGNILSAKVSVEEGEKLFKLNCATCHYVNDVLIGPALAKVNEKYAGDEEWLYKWIKNAPGMIVAGDEKAVALYEQYKANGMMNPMPFLEDAQIADILAYVDANDDPPPPAPPGENGSGDPVIDPGIYYTLMGVVALLALIAVLLVVITATLIVAVKSKEQEEEFTFADAWAQAKVFLGNKYVIAGIATFALLGGSIQTINTAREIGLHQGYMPEQPIKFSHKLHAGQYEIDCQYCHTGASKSKNAWIPSVNVCMNCHKGIKEGPKYGTQEISKIVEAYESGEAIEWVRIHNLPDHAYFNHAQHVGVGNLECQTCHGPVEEMEVVYQYNTLGMGWCIDCHRTEKVKVLGEETDLTVEDMGGLDCARCHY